MWSETALLIWLDLTVQEGYSLVILDPPYGITSEEWDQKAWMQKEFSKCLENVITWNTKAEKFTFITFCAADSFQYSWMSWTRIWEFQSKMTKKNTIPYTRVAVLNWCGTRPSTLLLVTFNYLSHDCTQPISPTSSLLRWCFFSWCWIHGQCLLRQVIRQCQWRTEISFQLHGYWFPFQSLHLSVLSTTCEGVSRRHFRECHS